MNEGPYISDRNMNNPKDIKYRNQTRGNRNFGYNNRYRGNTGGHRHQEKHQHSDDPTQSAVGNNNTEKNNVNGFVNN